MSDVNKRRILVVDDEPQVATIVRSYLEREGYEVAVATTGSSALEVFRRQKPDLIVLDVMLPSVDGLDVLREVRRDSQVPVIMLTARAESEDKLAGLELGADDYVTKPFSPRELTARVKAVLRRSAPEAGPSGKKPVRVGELAIDPDRFEASCHGIIVALTATEFRIMLFLAKRPGWVFTRQQIVDAAQGDDSIINDRFVTDRSVDVHIVSLRRKLASCGAYIETVRGVGYRLQDQ